MYNARSNHALRLNSVSRQLYFRDNEANSLYNRWTDDDGNTHFVKYIADEDGYRVLESNVVPADGTGVRADGRQGAFVSFEEDDDFDRK